ncbi:UNVERIFIED_CONTAM: hypothetical protein FKN15_075319 [Acipenser sinensis]
MEVELFSTVTGHLATEGDFTTGQYWAKNIGEPVAFEQAVKSAVAGKKHVVFVEIGPRRALQRNIMEIVGNGTPVFPSVRPDKDYDTLLTVVSKAFEVGLELDWEQFYKAYETLPTPCPRYQFDSIKNEVYFELVRQGNGSVASSIHPVLCSAGIDSKEINCNISTDATPYIYEHKNNGVVIVPGAFYVELGLASVMASVRPKLQLSSMQLSISFLSPCIVSQNLTELKIMLEQHKDEATFIKVKSPMATHASGNIQHCCENLVEEKNLLLEFIYKRCALVVKPEEVYEKLSGVGFQYGSVFRQLGDVHYGEELQEAVTRINVPEEVIVQLHEYCIHPVVLDYFLQMTATVAANAFKSRPGFPSGIGSLIVSQPLQKEMFMYLRTAKVTLDFLESVNKCEALVLLPPFDTSLVVKLRRVSNAKHIVVVCDSHLFLSASQSLLRSENEEVHIHILQIDNVFQIADLMKYKKDIYKRMKSMHFENKSLTLTRNIFQKQIMGSSDHRYTEEPESYFLSKSISLVVLNDVSKNRVSDIPLHEDQKQLFQRSSVYIVTGGLSGLGFETVKFIAQRGGGCIVILSRNAPSPERQQEITNVQNQYGVMMTSIQCDVAILKDVEKAISLICQSFPGCPIKRVFHSAVVLHDGLIYTLNRSHFDKVLRPKVAGALNLHYATKHCHLDYFICYSSITSFIGNSAQTNYAAANSFLDVFCHYRRNCGLAGQSINWGALNLGLLLNKVSFQRFLEAKGMVIMELPEIHEGLESCLLQDNLQQAVCKFNYKNLYGHVLSQNTSLRMRLYTVVTEELKNTDVTDPAFLQSTSLIKPDDYVRILLSEVSNADPDELTKDASLSAFGIDSMLAMTLQNRIFQERHVNVPLVKLLDPNTTVFTLVSLLQENYHGSPHYDEQDLSMSITAYENNIQVTKF